MRTTREFHIECPAAARTFDLVVVFFCHQVLCYLNLKMPSS
jgi:hypothetical protein